MKTGAVLTADIVNSSLLSPKDLDSLKADIEQEFVFSQPAVQFYRGDSFNVLVSTEKAMFEVAKLRAFARLKQPHKTKENVDIRIAIGIGQIDEPVLTMANGQGEAFTLSGRELDILSKSNKRLIIRCYDQKAESGLKAIAIYADYILSRLSVQQAQVFLEMLQGVSEKEAAWSLKKSQPTIHKLKKAALWDDFEQILNLYKDIVNDLKPVD